jgi:hypothetical protein
MRVRPGHRAVRPDLPDLSALSDEELRSDLAAHLTSIRRVLCARCGDVIHFAEGVWLDGTDGEGCADDMGREGVHTPAGHE